MTERDLPSFELGIRKPFVIHLIGSKDSGKSALVQECMTLAENEPIAHIQDNSAHIYLDEIKCFVKLDFHNPEKLNADSYCDEEALIFVYNSAKQDEESHVEELYDGIKNGDKTQPKPCSSVLIVAYAVNGVTSDDVVQSGEDFAKAKHTQHIVTSLGNVEGLYKEIKDLAIKHGNKNLQKVPQQGEELTMERVIFHYDKGAEADTLLSIFLMKKEKAQLKGEKADGNSKPEEQPYKRLLMVEHIAVLLNDPEQGVTLATSTHLGVAVDRTYPKPATAVVLVYDSCKEESLDFVKRTYKFMMETNSAVNREGPKVWPKDIPAAIVANKLRVIECWQLGNANQW